MGASLSGEKVTNGKLGRHAGERERRSATAIPGTDAQVLDALPSQSRTLLVEPGGPAAGLPDQASNSGDVDYLHPEPEEELEEGQTSSVGPVNLVPEAEVSAVVQGIVVNVSNLAGEPLAKLEMPMNQTVRCLRLSLCKEIGLNPFAVQLLHSMQGTLSDETSMRSLGDSFPCFKGMITKHIIM